MCEESDRCLHSEEGQVVSHEDYSTYLIDQGLKLEASASLSCYGENLILMNLFDTKYLLILYYLSCVIAV